MCDHRGSLQVICYLVKVIGADEEKDDWKDDEEPGAGPGVLHHQLAEDPVDAGQAAGHALPRHDGLGEPPRQQSRQTVHRGLLDRGGQREDGDQEQHQGVGLVGGEGGGPDQQEEGGEHHQGHQVPEHDPGLQAERLYDHVVQEDRYQRSEDVDQADVEDDCGAGKDFLEEVHGSDEAVVGKKEANAGEEQDDIDGIVLRWYLIK